ncbi:MAG: hypothetical protein ACREFP_14925 [Acetobacteraceae bacterium]
MDALKDRIRRALLDHAQAATTTTYRDLADFLGLAPPQTIHRVTDALELLMAEDAAAGRPLLAALCLSNAQPGVPGRGFFLTAQELGIFDGDPAGPEAASFHAQELARAVAFYRGDRGCVPG